jgi:hypothetical protein
MKNKPKKDKHSPTLGKEIQCVQLLPWQRDLCDSDLLLHPKFAQSKQEYVCIHYIRIIHTLSPLTIKSGCARKQTQGKQSN